RIGSLAFQVVALVETVQGGLDDAWVLARLYPLLQAIARGPAGDVDEGGHPVEGGEELIVHRARLDMSRPPNAPAAAITAPPGVAAVALERGDAAGGEGDSLRAVVGGEDHDGVIELAHGLQLRKHDTDVVIHLLHSRLVDAPVLAAPLAHHGHVLVR